MFGLDLILLLTGGLRHLPTTTSVAIVGALVAACVVAIVIDHRRTRR